MRAAAASRPGGDEDVDHLAVLVDGAVHVAPDTAHPQVGLIDEPAATDRMPTGVGGVDQLGGEALDPSVDRDVVDGDASSGEEFLDVAVRETEPQVPAHGEQNHVGREPVAGERRARHGNRTATRSDPHPAPIRPST